MANSLTVHSSHVEEMLSPASGTMSPTDWFIASLGRGGDESGVNVTTENVLTSGPVYQAVTTIAGDLAGMEIQVLRSTLEPDRNHPAWGLLNESAHEEIGSFTFRETLMSWALLHGNGLAYIDRRGTTPVALIPLAPNCVYPWRDQDSGVLTYIYHHPESGMRHAFFQDEVLHFRGLGNALWGESIFELMRRSVGNSLAAEKFQGHAYSNGLSPSGVFTKDGPFPEEARAELRREIERLHQGITNARKALILTHGVQYHPMGITHKDAELLDSIKFSREQIAAFFCLPPYKLGSLENSAVRANLEQSQREYLQSTLWRWICIQTNEVCRKLLSPKQRERRSHCVRFDTDALVAADIAARYTSYGQGIMNGWMSPNEARAKEGLPPIAGGNVYLLPLNMDAYGPDAAVHESEDMEDPAKTESETDTESIEEQMLAFADRQVQSLQGMEATNLLRKKKPDLIAEFYSQFKTKLLERLEPMTALQMFTEQAISDAVVNYCDRSCVLATGGAKDMEYDSRRKELVKCLSRSS